MTTTETRPVDEDDGGEEEPRPIRLYRFKIQLIGTSALLMHNERLADPLDPFTKAIKKITSKKRDMTDADRDELARQEFLGGLYLDPIGGPFIPAWNIERCLREGALITRSGKKIERGIRILDDPLPLVEYRGPRDPEAMWRDGRFRSSKLVRVSRARTVRTRPMFHEWSIEAEGFYDPTVISLESLAQIAETAGLLTGLGDFRQRYGRFESLVEPIDEVAA